MSETVTYVTQSRFFSPEFNAAIFDGPIRIYFAQYQEALALKLYHNLQERFGDIRKNARGIFREKGRNIFVMLYPTNETFDSSFPAPVMIAKDSLGSDFVVGVRGPLGDEYLDALFETMDGIVKTA
jgi:hypothetical protein